MRLSVSTDGLDLVAVTQDVGQAHESLGRSRRPGTGAGPPE
ncbi:MAG TPA: hypothetical protein VFI47_10235 [Acidimicrobiales bacterium]|nr:hypothetical protein [Acidimicrobiales bacterium]